jgi:hypothetical protein
MSNNVYKVEGIIFGKPVRTADGKKGTKNEGKTFEFPSIILEIRRTHKGTDYSELPEFELGWGVHIDDFAVRDKVEITFALAGKKISDTFHKTSLKALYIKHSDIQGDDTKDVNGEPKWKKESKDDIFIPPNPYNDDEDGDLPF